MIENFVPMFHNDLNFYDLVNISNKLFEAFPKFGQESSILSG